MIPNAQHPDVDALRDLAQGYLSDEDRVRLLEHLQGCPECADLAERVEAALGSAEALAAPASDPGERTVGEGAPPLHYLGGSEARLTDLLADRRRRPSGRFITLSSISVAFCLLSIFMLPWFGEGDLAVEVRVEGTPMGVRGAAEEPSPAHGATLRRGQSLRLALDGGGDAFIYVLMREGERVIPAPGIPQGLEQGDGLLLPPRPQPALRPTGAPGPIELYVLSLDEPLEALPPKGFGLGPDERDAEAWLKVRFGGDVRAVPLRLVD